MERKDFVAQQVSLLQQDLVSSLGQRIDEAVQYGVDSVVIPEQPAPPPVVGADASEQEKIDAAVAQARAEAQVQIDELKASLEARSADLEKALSDDESDKAAIAKAQAEVEASKSVISQIEAILHPAAPAPVEA